MHKHHHCCRCPECYEVTRMAALRRMEPPTYGEWQHEQYGYGGYGSQTLPSQGGATPTARNKGKLIPTSRDNVPAAPPKQSQGKTGTPKMNGNSPGWWPECTCSNRDWYEQPRSTTTGKQMGQADVPLTLLGSASQVLVAFHPRL
uniref:Uncharacterized protein n=1 Tax=Sphaerodactylus townsendi TaxID=933632 RepID=A0ACB8FY44_9SAUR